MDQVLVSLKSMLRTYSTFESVYPLRTMSNKVLYSTDCNKSNLHLAADHFGVKKKSKVINLYLLSSYSWKTQLA